MIPAVYSVLDALRPAFSRQRSFTLVAALLMALMTAGKYTTLTSLFLQLRVLLPSQVSRYWSLPKSLARRRWEPQQLIILFLRFLLEHLPESASGYLLADVTHTTTQGRKQQARHLRPNPHYRKKNQNQSKFWAGNSALSLAYVLTEHTLSGLNHWVFGLGCLLLRPSRRTGSETAMLRRVIAAIAPKGMLVVYDRGGNDAATINCFVRRGLRFITRLNVNAALYADPACKQKIDLWCYCQTLTRGSTKIYRHEVLCYRKKVRSRLKAVIEICYNRSRREWRLTIYVSTDRSMSAEEIVSVYRTRRQIEGVHADSKLVCGFNSCRVHSATSIEAYLCLSLLACGILEYARYCLRHPAKIAAKHPAKLGSGVTTLEILERLGMHWYRPTGLTRGLVARYAEHQLQSDPSILSTFRAYFSRQSAGSPCSARE
jgi:hypothetical protein